MDFSHVVIGAGAVGLATAAKLSLKSNKVLLIERLAQVGMETSSRNSEVIHAGIYHPPNSLKSKLCIRGKELIYGIKNFPYTLNCGKFIVSQNLKENEYLHKLVEIGKQTGVPLQFVTNSKSIVPQLIANGLVLHSPSTGIINSHMLMMYYLKQFTENGGDLALQTEVTNLVKINSGYEVNCTSAGENISIKCNKVINCAGLHAVEIAEMAGINKYQQYYAKGNYFSYQGKEKVSKLIYPCPPDNGSLGTHLTIDLNGNIKFGPDFEFVDSIDYKVNQQNLEQTKSAVKRFLNLDTTRLKPDYCGIRPKISNNVSQFCDFVIKEEVPNFINLVGIESPGLTASMAIAEYVDEIANR